MLNDLQATSMARNSILDITGVLIATPHYFAGLLEGPRGNVASVMAEILADPRHHDVRIVGDARSEAARYTNWCMMTFNGQSLGEGATEAIIAAVHERVDPEALRKLERLFDSISFGRSGLKA
jgi:hypothetical protein